MKCTILGCGGSNGVPHIGCNCWVCSSSDKKDKRLRASILVEYNNHKILVDTSPDLRQQALRHNITRVDAILYTHDHADHTAGIDDARRLTKGPGHQVDVYMGKETKETLRSRFNYAFDKLHKLYTPFMRIKNLEPYKCFSIGGLDILPFKQNHGNLTSYGFRFGNLVYSTDVESFPSASFSLLKNVDTWIIDCLRYHWAPTHSYLEKTLEWARRIKAKKVLLTHMGHDIGYQELKNLLPSHIEPAYDGMCIEC